MPISPNAGTHVIRLLLCACLLGALIGVSVTAASGAGRGGARGHRPPSPQPDPVVLEELAALAASIAQFEDVPRGWRVVLRSRLGHVARELKRGRVCKAVAELDKYIGRVDRLPPRRVSDASRVVLRYHGQRIRRMVLDGAPEGGCTGYDRVGAVPSVDVGHSDAQSIQLTVTFGEPERHPHTGDDGIVYERLVLPGLPDQLLYAGEGDPIGKPGVPMFHRLIAVPIGAEASLTATVVARSRIENLLLYPQQGTPEDQDLPPGIFDAPPFERDDAAYERSELYPRQAVTLTPVGKVRDLELVQVSVAPVQYSAARKTAIVNEVVDVRVDYVGGSGGFLTKRAGDPFETHSNRQLMEGSVLNGDVVYESIVDDGGFAISYPGQELLILAHRDFEGPAYDLAAWKREKGIVTSVFFVGESDIEPTTEAIKDFLQDRWDHSRVRPSYVLLLGDIEYIPTWVRTFVAYNGQTKIIPSDLDYSLLSGTDLLADVGLARIPVDFASGAQVVVDKIIDYEKTPPFAFPFYQKATVAAYFQCCHVNGLIDESGQVDPVMVGREDRDYIRDAETIRAAVAAEGFQVERVYKAGPGETVSDGHYAEDQTPRRYRLGDSLPDDIGPDSGFEWNAGPLDVTAAFEEGRFLIVHRDHGYFTFWGNPYFDVGHATSLQNGSLLPVLFSINCYTGAFDRTQQGLVEALLRHPNGGVVGAIGDTRLSPTYANSPLSIAFVDAVFPNTLTDYGPEVGLRRLADILNYGKLYMYENYDTEYFDSMADWESILFHAYGDPTQEIWVRKPLILPLEFEATPFESYLEVTYAGEGATITATQNGRAVGRATVVDGRAIVDFVHPPSPGAPIDLSASRPGSVARLLTPPPAGDLPDLVVEVSAPASVPAGTDLASEMSVIVANLGDADAPGKVDEAGEVTGEGYSIDFVLSTDESVPEGFAVVSPTFQEDALLVGGRISRTPAVPAQSSVTLSSAPPISSDVGGVVPPDTPPGDYFLCGRIDPGDEVEESDEGNNLTCIPLGVE